MATVTTKDRVQVTVDGKDWLFQENRPVEDVPANVVKALDEAGFKYETGKKEEK